MSNLPSWLAARRKLAENATKGPWWFDFNWIGNRMYAGVEANGYPGYFVAEHRRQSKPGGDATEVENMEFIADARDSLPLACDLIEIMHEALMYYAKRVNSGGQTSRDSLARVEALLEGKP